jgi:hypothetical protein
MKKFLKITGILFLILILGIVVLYFTGDKDFEVTRTKTIKVPVELVYAKVADFNEFNSFNPWYDLDETQTTSVKGEGLTVGSEFSWDSKSKDVGKGLMVITNLEENKTVDMDITTYMPMENTNKCGFNLSKSGEMETEVTWYLKGDSDFIGKVMSNFMSIEDFIGPKYEKGLELLRAGLEGK